MHINHSAMFRNRFWLSLILTIPVIIYSPIIQNWFSFTPPNFIFSNYIPLILSTVIFFYCGLPFIKGSLIEIKSKLPGMMTLISLSIITAYFYSLAVTFFIKGDSFFWELVALITIMLLGHWIEIISIQKTENALGSIQELLPDKADKIINGTPKQILVSELKLGDLVLVRPGSNIPVDGIIYEGKSSVDESIITGESKLISKIIGDKVIAGMVNQEGALTIKVTKLGDDTTLAGIIRLIKEAQLSKSKTQILADRVAFILTIVAIVVSTTTFIIWLILKDSGFAFERAITVLVIACPHALGLAIPLVVSVSTTLAARNGLLIRQRTALESARKINMVLFDKTGTLTKGNYSVINIFPTKGYNDKQILHLAASLEQNSEHSISKGIVKKANELHIKLDKVLDFEVLSGVGIRGNLYNGEIYIATNQTYLLENKIEIPTDIFKQINQIPDQSKLEVYLIFKNKIIGVVVLGDIIRDEAKLVINNLKALGLKISMITGDSEDEARYVSGQLGIDQYFARIKPEEKSEKIKDLQKQGFRIMMVGDGINDAPALTQADIGVAIGAGTDIAIKSADIILINSNLKDVTKIIKLSKFTYQKMIQNLIWATTYNLVTIPLAAGVLYYNGIVLSPSVGAIFMSISAIIVVLNAQLLRRLKL